MTGPAALAAAVLAAGSGQRAPVAVGVVNVAMGSSLATVTGIAAEPLPVDKSSWHAHFISEVATAGGAMSGRRVIVLFVDRQPMILGTTGV